MKKYLFSFICCFLLVVVGTLLSCKSSSVPSQAKSTITKNVTTTETQHDSIFKTPGDASQYKATVSFEGDKAVLTQVKSTPSKAGVLQPPKVNLQDNNLTVDCETYAQEYLAKWKEYRTVEESLNETVIPIEVPRELSFLETLQIWSGRLLFFLIVAFLFGRFVIKPKTLI